MEFGTLHDWGVLTSQFAAPRRVQVWLPPAYSSQQRCRVVYMHDGQNLFRPEDSYIGVDWGVAPTLGGLIGAGDVPATLVVGIWNTSLRMSEYMPATPLQHPRAAEFRRSLEAPGSSDGYLRFLVEELKPMIDANYATLAGREDTFVLGSSMGGLISLYALCEYPRVFGGAACLSTHWPPGDGIVIDYLGHALPRPGRHALYFDLGTETADAAYPRYQARADALVQRLGWQMGRDFTTLHFPGEEHSERAWRARLHLPLRFLLAGAR